MKKEDMRGECMYCGLHLWGDRRLDVISHGVCKPCKAKALEVESDDINAFDHPGFWEFGLPVNYTK
jgi:hypothetical protein